jgi:hypothetical protein
VSAKDVSFEMTQFTTSVPASTFQTPSGATITTS